MTASRDKKIAALRLIRSENVGTVAFYNLVRMFGSPEKALDYLPRLAARGGKKSIVVCSEKDAEQELNAVLDYGGDILIYDDQKFPFLLKTLGDTPPVITVVGNQKLFESQRILAIVGSRNASANGCRFARQLSRDVGEAGVCVVSGLARGIDKNAHEAALDTGTIAVIAGGIDVIYPKENTDLYHAIRHKGLIITEDPFGVVPQARHFPKRNRLISGLSHGVLVVEAAAQSGSLITARYALEQGRDVFAVPGSPLDPRCHGPNNLIRQGAILVESAGDVLDVLRPHDFSIRTLPGMMAFEEGTDYQSGHAIDDDNQELARARDIIQSLLSPSPTVVDDLMRETGIPPHLCHVVLLEMDLAGRLEHHPGHRVSLIMGEV